MRERKEGRTPPLGRKLSFLVEIVLSELKKVALRHRKLIAAVVGTVTGLMLAVPLLSSPLLLKMALQHLGPMGTVALVAFGAFMAINNASIVLSGPKRASQRPFLLSLFLFLFLLFEKVHRC